jgi:hypothetical protein
VGRAARRAGVILDQRSCRYDPDLNPTYQEFAMHYDVGVVPSDLRLLPKGTIGTSTSGTAIDIATIQTKV